jgi:hypothetical protein
MRACLAARNMATEIEGGAASVVGKGLGMIECSVYLCCDS